ncbi:MAG: hypothetical protein A2Y07_02440 [Planctomycetes bacterium GWF2_50_10]|nr:MAG: hypothetical protein A2Y07_02440 [Planctomycetes bacterium GWF2_50_10]
MHVQKKNKYIAILLFAAVGAGVLVWASLDSNWIKTMSVEEYLGKAVNLKQQQIQLYGKVAGTADANGGGFDLKGSQGGLMHLSYDKTYPSNFKVGADVLVNGQVDEKGGITINSILTKCPSRYTSRKTK